MTPSLVTVAIPVRNGAAVIGEQLAALAAQAHDGPWELVVVDNGSSDGTADVVLSHAGALPSVRVVREDRVGIGPARNRALAEARGDVLAICDADDVVQAGWLSALVRGLEDHDAVGGYADMTLANPEQVLAWRGGLPPDQLPVAIGAWPFAPGGNMAVRTDVARALGGWDETYVGGSDDVDFSWRLVRAGYRLGFAPDAVIAYRVRAGLRGLMRQFWQYGLTESLLYSRHREHGLPTYSVRALLRLWRGLAPSIVKGLLVGDVTQRGIALRKLAYHGGRFAGSLKHRVVFP